MPFAYYGAKHGLASKYPRPRHRVIVEPFAGSAAYSVHHAANIDHAILIDADARLVELWHEIQGMTEADVDLIGKQLEQARFTHPLLAAMAGSTTMLAVLAGKDRAVTPRMLKDWPCVRSRIIRALPHVKTWDVTHGTYADALNVEATWFIDPPYMQQGTMAGAGYAYSDESINFDHLARWSRSRNGFVMVCEQSPAAWLPFHPFASQANGAGTGTVARQEVIWRSDMEQPMLWEAS